MNYETVIGLEVHVQLKTRTKAFCGCSTEFGQEPNTQVCPVCLGFPGTLPVLNRTVLDYGIKVGLALDCTIQPFTKFDRKHYFYPDLPKNYQISQYDLPLAKDGFLNIILSKENKLIRIKRVHIEEDAGKLIHKEEDSLVDFNRTGVPLLEIVTEPDISSPLEAYEYLTALKSILEYLEISDCDMEKGSLRCDANISLRPVGAKELGTKAELKNMNSFKGVKDALEFEIQRQSKALDNAEKIIQETRLWDAKLGQSFSMRTKEEAQDYRYLPDPDLVPFLINADKIQEIKQALPELPSAKKIRFIKDYGLSEYDAGVLTMSKKEAQYAEECFHAYSSSNKKPVVNLLIGSMLSEANLRKCPISGLNITPAFIVELVGFCDREEISNLTAKSVLAAMIESRKSAGQIIREKNLIQISDTSELEQIVDLVVKENTKSVTDYKQGKTTAIMALVGGVMKKSGGKANPKIVQEILKRRLADV